MPYKEYYAEHKQKIIAYNKEWKKRNRDKVNASTRRYRDKNRERINAKNREWEKNNPEKVKANRVAAYERNKEKYKWHGKITATVNYALKCGKIAKTPCEICGEERAFAHHDDYGEPLKVRWLCRKCHEEWHKNNTPKNSAWH